MGQLLIDKPMHIDASTLTAGVAISGNQFSRVFEVTPGIAVSMRNLTITEGRTADGGPTQNGEHGGGIFNLGVLTLIDCTITRNRTGDGGLDPGSIAPGNGGTGGGIANAGTLTLLRCSVTHNSTGRGGPADIGHGYGGEGRWRRERRLGHGSGPLRHHCLIAFNSTGESGGLEPTGGHGGGISNRTEAVLTNCTVHGNTLPRGGHGGGVINHGTITLSHCTVTNNEAGADRGSGGGIHNTRTQILDLRNSIVAANRAPIGTDVFSPEGDTVVRSGVNFIGSNDSLSYEFPAGAPNSNGDQVGTAGSPLPPKLSPLGDFGGPSLSRIPLRGSTVIDAAPLSPITADQRGMTRDPLRDLGATEYQGQSDLALLWTSDTDRDGNPFGLEQALGNRSPQARPGRTGEHDPTLVLGARGDRHLWSESECRVPHHPAPHPQHQPGDIHRDLPLRWRHRDLRSLQVLHDCRSGLHQRDRPRSCPLLLLSDRGALPTVGRSTRSLFFPGPAPRPPAESGVRPRPYPPQAPSTTTITRPRDYF